MTMEEILTSGLAELGVPATAAQLSQLRAYYTLLDERSKVMNLTAIEGEEATARLHFLDSAALLRYVRLSGKTAVDMAAFIENGIAQAEEYYAAIEGMTDVGAAAQTTKFLGGEYDSILTTATYNGFPTQSLQVCIPLEQYICVVTFTSYVEDRTDEMMGFFSTIAASK